MLTEQCPQARVAPRNLGRIQLGPLDIDRMRVRADVDLYLDPPVTGFPMFDWSRLEELAETGYRFALRRIEQWRHSSVACRRSLDPFGTR